MIKNLFWKYKLYRFEKALERIEKITNGRLKLIKNLTPILDGESNSLAYGIMVAKNNKIESPIVYIPIDEII